MLERAGQPQMLGYKSILPLSAGLETGAGLDVEVVRILPVPAPIFRRAISCRIIISEPSNSIFLSIWRKPAELIKSRTLFLSTGISIEVPSICVPSIEIRAPEAAAAGEMSTVTLAVRGTSAAAGAAGFGATATGVGAGVGAAVGWAVAATVGAAVGATATGRSLGRGSVAASLAPVPKPNRRPQNTPTASPAETTIGTVRGVRRSISSSTMPLRRAFRFSNFYRKRVRETSDC